ncbi:FHA domain-containing protein [Desulfovibrio sp. An276]|uniref:FHA domain-containing protein n=1 Tax=Desulfovibrio sp. An276 TaxID=1965618 RepID=UPI0013A67F92|nr:FHA domain-containing protein [Desulfovibrio sp. An276]
MDNERFRRCINGHIVPNGAKFCPWCGESILLDANNQRKSETKNNTITFDIHEIKNSSKNTIVYDHNYNDKTVVLNKSNNKLDGFGRITGFLITYDINEFGVFYPIHEGKEIIGRGTTATIQIDDKQLSKEHAVILSRHDKFIFEDLLSTNGSYVNGIDILGKIELNHADIIEIGKYKYIFVKIPNIINYSIKSISK